MRGKMGLVIGLAAGYVLGTRAGRERYEQIREQAGKVWNLDPVQKQVDRAKDFAASTTAAVPGVLWDGVVKVTRAVQGKDGSGDAAKAAPTVDDVEKKIKDAASPKDVGEN